MPTIGNFKLNKWDSYNAVSPQDITTVSPETTSNDDTSFGEQRREDIEQPLKQYFGDIKSAPSWWQKGLFAVTGLEGALLGTPLSLITAPLSRWAYKQGETIGQQIPISGKLLNSVTNATDATDKFLNSSEGKTAMAVLSLLPETGVAANSIKTAGKVIRNPSLLKEGIQSAGNAAKFGAGLTKEFVDEPNKALFMSGVALDRAGKATKAATGKITRNLSETLDDVKNAGKNINTAFKDGTIVPYLAQQSKQGIKQFVQKEYDSFANPKYLPSDQDIINALVTQATNQSQYDNSASGPKGVPRQVTISNLGGNNNADNQATQQTIPLGGSWGNMPLRYGTSGNPVLQHLMYRNQLQRK